MKSETNKLPWIETFQKSLQFILLPSAFKSFAYIQIWIPKMGWNWNDCSKDSANTLIFMNASAKNGITEKVHHFEQALSRSRFHEWRKAKWHTGQTAKFALNQDEMFSIEFLSMESVRHEISKKTENSHLTTIRVMNWCKWAFSHGHTQQSHKHSNACCCM